MDFILNLLSSDEVDGLLRHVFSTSGGTLVAHGVMTTNEWTTIAGGGMALFSVLLSIANKKYMRSQVKA